jgi:hypothetical protein
VTNLAIDLAVNLDKLLITIIINTIILSPVLWLAGKALVGGAKAKFTDAILIILIGTVIGTIFGAYFTGYLAFIIQLILWLLLVKHFFDCGWLKALAISILAVIIFVIIAIILGLIGLAIIAFVLW